MEPEEENEGGLVIEKQRREWEVVVRVLREKKVGNWGWGRQ